MRFLIAIALLYSILPGISEVAEAAAHLIVHADLPHHGDVVPDDGCAEHSCTTLAHHCSCHTTMSAQPASRSVAASTAYRVTGTNPGYIVTVRGRSCEPPPLRPPIG